MNNDTFLYTVDWVKNKIRQLRNSYTKAKKAPPSGSPRKAPTKRTAWLLDKLQFLAPYVAARPTASNLNAVSNSVLRCSLIKGPCTPLGQHETICNCLMQATKLHLIIKSYYKCQINNNQFWEFVFINFSEWHLPNAVYWTISSI